MAEAKPGAPMPSTSVPVRTITTPGATVGAVVCALTYLALEPYLLEWKGFRDKQEELTSRLERAENMLARRESVTARLAEIRQGLPVFPAGKKVEAELLMM